MDADLAMVGRLRISELEALATIAAERDDLESQWIHQLLREELQALEKRMGPLSLCESCPPRVAAVCPRKRPSG